MICCDRCDGWFHYECIGMQSPAPGEEDENAENVKFACPECCAAQGIPYVPFRPAPKDTDKAPERAAPPPAEEAPEPPKTEEEAKPPAKPEPEVADNKQKRKPVEPTPPANKSTSSRSRRRK